MSKNSNIKFLPQYFTKKAIVGFFVALVVCSLLFRHLLPGLWILFSILEVVLFFYFANVLTKKWQLISEKVYKRKLFWSAFIIRAVWVVFSYFLFIAQTGQPFEFYTADANMYHNWATTSANYFSTGGFQQFFDSGEHFSDLGYPMYLTVIYLLFGKSIIIARLFFALWSALTCILVYNLAKRNFGETTARIAGILTMLLPNLIYYCGLHLKEPLMVFLLVLFIERLDLLLRSPKINIFRLLIVFILGLSLFFFRTALGIALLFALFTTLTFSSSRIAKWRKRILLGVWFISLISIFFSSQIETTLVESFQLKDVQEENMEWRAERETGNELAKYGSAVIFAPIILFAPFPTLVNIEYQKYQMMLSGAYYIKNIYIFFVILCIIYLYRKKLYRKHLLILAFMFAYLAALAQSSFAISERFHLPLVPFFLIFAAYGITLINNKNKKYYIPYLVFILIAIIGWNWFKLAGRGAI